MVCGAFQVVLGAFSIHGIFDIQLTKMAASRRRRRRRLVTKTGFNDSQLDSFGRN